MKFAPPDTYEDNNTPSLYINRSLGFIVQCFQFEFLADNVIDFLTGLVQSAPQYYQRLSTETIRNIIVSPKAETWLSDLQNGDFTPEATRYPEFLLSLVEREDLSSPAFLGGQYSDRVIGILQVLLQCTGAAVVEDGVCHMVLDAFSQIVEGYLDWMGSGEADQYMTNLIANVCGSCLVKVQYPPEEMDSSTQTWDPNDRSKFKDFRRDVEDFLLSAFSALGPALLRNIVHSLLDNDAESTWESFEAGIFCLGTLSDTMSNNTDQYDSLVSSIFSTSKWNAVVQNTTTIPSRARQGAIKYISQNTTYLQRHQDQMVPCLNFLFSSLQSRTSTPAASRAIQTLCDTQRSSLVSTLPQFVASLSSLPEVPSDDKHRLYGAVAAVIQALPNEDEKVDPLSEMLDMLSRDLPILSSLVNENNEDALPTALDLLQSLTAIGKGLRAPAETTIDLDSEPHSQSQYWKEGPGKAVQDRAQAVFLTIMSITPFRFGAQIIEAVCEFMKAGYTEEDPSPFKFAPNISASFFANKIHLSTPNLSIVMATASSFLSSTPPTSLDAAFPALIERVVDAQRTLLSTFAVSKQYADHDFTYSSLDFLVRLLPKWGGRLFIIPSADQSLQIMLEFALLALENPDTLPRRSSASFWAALFDQAGYSSTLPTPALSVLGAAIQAYAARFVCAVVRLLAGECARSELDALAEPLKKFVAKHSGLARGLLRAAMGEDAGVLSGRAMAAVGGEVRMRFVGQVEALRGGRKTNEVVKEFWVACRGSAYGYTA